MALLPFAYSKEIHKLVSVDEVSRGLLCNCICPSCGMLVVAKHGDVKEHHFSHASGADATCLYSYWVSMRDMARQILKEAQHLHIDMIQTHNIQKLPYPDKLPLIVIHSVEKKNNGFDMELTSSLGILDVYFVTPEEDHKGIMLDRVANMQRLVLEINLNSMSNESRHSKKEQLRKVLLESNRHKRLIAPKFVFKKKERKQDPKRQSNSSQREDEPLSIPRIKARMFNTDKIVRALNLDPRSLTFRQKSAIDSMYSFFTESEKLSLAPSSGQDYEIVYKEGVYQLVSYYGEFYYIADVDGIFVLYSFKDGEFVKIHSSRNYELLKWKLNKLREEEQLLF